MRGRDLPVADEPVDELRVVDDLVLAAELGVLVGERIERMRVAGDDALHAEAVQRLDQRLRERLEEHLVAGAANALARGALARRPGSRSGRPRPSGSSRRPSPSSARGVEGLRRAHVEEPVDVLRLLRAFEHRHALLLRPVAARVGRQPPRVGLALVGVEDGLQLLREGAFHHHLVLAQAVEAAEVLEPDRAGALAVAAGGAGPERLLRDDLAHERRKLRLACPRRSPRASPAGGA